MDSMFCILIPKSNLNKLNISERKVEWEGEIFSQEPPKFKFQTSIFFYQTTEISYFQRIVEDKLDLCDYTGLVLEGEGLRELEFMVNNKEFSECNSELLSFFYELYDSLDTFCIINSPDDENIEDIFTVLDATEAIKVFTGSLNWTSSKGIVIIKKAE